jgi:hypothetical protein
MNHMNESPFSSENGFFSTKLQNCLIFARIGRGMHHEKAEVSGIRIVCFHLYPLDSLAIFCCRLQQAPFGVRQRLGAGL